MDMDCKYGSGPNCRTCEDEARERAAMQPIGTYRVRGRLVALVEIDGCAYWRTGAQTTKTGFTTVQSLAWIGLQPEARTFRAFYRDDWYSTYLASNGRREPNWRNWPLGGRVVGRYNWRRRAAGA